VCSSDLGIQTSAITLGRLDVSAVMGFYGIYLLIWFGIAAWHFSVAGRPGQSVLWLWPGVVAALGLMAWHYRLICHRTREGCHTAFLQSHWISFAMFAGIALGLA
jgi:4-hydroxybenzoate polyprenyltransferase